MKQKMSIYVPVKDDPVDVALADFVNNYPDRRKLRVMFLRCEPGVYDFGSRKVSLRIEQNKVKVRVGGGWIGVEEFLD